MLSGLITALVGGLFFLGTLPTTTTYQLNSFGFGSGGGANNTTSNYTLEGITGEVSSTTGNTTTYNSLPGFIQTQQANVPKVTLSNTGSYNSLKIVIDTQGNPTDALFALQIRATDCNFSDTANNKYVKSDNSVGASLATTDYQNYAAWGSGSGVSVTGLSISTTYCIRAKATQHLFSQSGGRFTETAYGPSSSATTSGETISFCVYLTNVTCSTPGGTLGLGSLPINTVTSSSPNIGIDFATNASSGGNVFVYSANGGLKSPSTSYTVISATADLSSAAEGFGARVASTSQSSGGPLNKVSPYNGSGNNVGILSTTTNAILSTSGPLVGGSASINLQAKPSYAAPATSDYSETLTFVAAALF